MFRFPLFETIHWYAGVYLLQQLRRINEEQQVIFVHINEPYSSAANLYVQKLAYISRMFIYLFILNH